MLWISGGIITIWFLFCVLKIELTQSISIAVLAVTGLAIFMQTLATKKMAEYQIMPAVDVNMIYEKSIRKTYFWFSNASSIPAFVSIKFNININDVKKEGKTFSLRLRIPPNHPHLHRFMKTATTFDFLKENFSDKTEVILNITVTPAFDDGRNKFNFTKSYRFNNLKLRWDEASWGYPDPSFPNRGSGRYL